MIPNIMHQRREMHRPPIDLVFQLLRGMLVNMVRHGHDALDVVPAVGGVVALHILFDIGSYCLD